MTVPAFSRVAACLLDAVSISTTLADPLKSKEPAIAAYDKTVKDAIGPLWYHYMETKGRQVAPGKLTLSFRITAKGQVTNLKIMSNTSDALLQTICTRTIREAKFQPLPRSVLKILAKSNRDSLEIDGMNFIIYAK